MTTRKESILNRIEALLKTIITGNVEPKSGHVFQNTVSYVDRQYLVFDLDDVATHPKPWIIVNNNGEKIGTLVGKKFENTILIDIIGFVSASDSNPNLDTMMNILQKDIFVAMLTDDNLSGLASYVLMTNIETVPEMVWPHGGFSMSMEITYNFFGLDM